MAEIECGETDLQALLPVKQAALLAECGIATPADLRRVGACYAFLLLKDGGLSVTNSVFKRLLVLCGELDWDSWDETAYRDWLRRLREHPPVRCFPDEAQMRGFMMQALAQAERAAELGEVPVGAVVVHRGKVIAAAYNRCVADCNISHHAEIQALAAAGQVLGNYRLGECDLYVSLEPCTMCAGAIVQARIRRLVFAAAEPKTGAAGSVLNVFARRSLNAHTAVLGGVMAEEAKDLLRRFFVGKRG